ncbi:MAG: hypothetical protein ABSD47_01220 [Candidatus Methylomirabilota bacterium]|jgi:hypothetical protein
MNATWALRRHVSAGAMRILCDLQGGPVRAWPLIRVLWLSGVLDGRRPIRNVEWNEAPDGIQPEVPCWRLGEEVWN